MSRGKAARFRAASRVLHGGQSGLAILEFALVVVFILLVAMSGLELSHSLRLLEISTTLNREIASAGYRNCAGGVPSEHAAGTFNFYNECLADSLTNISTGAATVLPNSTMILSLYEFVPAGADPSVGSFVRRGIAAHGSSTTRYSVSDDGAKILGDIDSTAASSHRWVVIAEIYVPYGIRTSIVGVFRPDFFYDATII